MPCGSRAEAETFVTAVEAAASLLTSLEDGRLKAALCQHGALRPEFDVQAVQVKGISGDFRSPECAFGSYSSEVPAGATARPTCALRSPTGDSHSALICTPLAARATGVNGECGAVPCQAISGAEWCAHTAPEGQLATIATKILLAPEAEANPMHYGEPAICNEFDVQAV